MKNFLTLFLLLIVTACSTTEGLRSHYNLEDSSIIDTSAEAQARFKAEWINNTRGKYYTGSLDVWGGGTIAMDLTFNPETGSLWDSFHNNPKWWSLKHVLAFKSGTQAVVRFYITATSSSTLYRSVYSLEIREDGLYRTQNIQGNRALGWSTVDKWDGKTYSQAYLEKIASLKPSKPILRPDWDK